MTRAPAERDPTGERVFLSAAAEFVSPSPFVEHCERRLAQGERDFGGRWAGLTLDDFARELREEGADLGAWSALAAQSIELASLPPALKAPIEKALHTIARRGAQAHRQADVIQRLLAAHTTSEGDTP